MYLLLNMTGIACVGCIGSSYGISTFCANDSEHDTNLPNVGKMMIILCLFLSVHIAPDLIPHCVSPFSGCGICSGM